MTSILVIEDETLLREEVVAWLQLEDFEAFGAENGMVGVELALRYVPDLIICDITMPKLDGYGVLFEIRGNPTTSVIPFIFVTARASHDDIRLGMGAGADDYITKPFTRLELLKTIQTRLEKKSKQEIEHQQEIEQWQHALQHEREQRMLKTKMVAMFSHDFRTPLTSILMSTSLLRDYADRMDEVKRLTHFHRIESSVRQVQQMVDDMLVISQMETGNFHFQPQVLEVEVFLQSIIEELKNTYGESRPIIFESHYDNTILADPRLMRQIATNLISNAVKYSPQSSEVKVILDSQDSLCSITIQDHGIGIPDADQAHIFEAFHRASNTGLITGTGLGLAIVKQAVDLQQGFIEINSKVDVGTTVTVTLPIT